MTGHVERLAPEHDFTVRRLPLSWYVDRIGRRSFFSYTKINHRFWELELELRRNPPGSSPEARAAADRALGRSAYLETGFREELLSDLASLPAQDPDFLFATSHEGYPGSCRLEGATPDPGAIFALMRRLLPEGLQPHDGMLFKRSTISGEIRAFYAALRDLSVLVVGPDWLEGLGACFDLPDCTHLPIPSRDARATRREILERIVAARARLEAGRDVAILFEAGSLSAWLIRRLHGRLPRTFLIDVGRPLDVCRPDVLFRHNWGRVFRRELEDRLGIVDRRARDSRDVFDPARRTPHAQTTCSATALERDLAEHLNLPEDWRLVSTASGPAALRVLSTLERLRSGRPLRWLAPAFLHPRAATVSTIARARRIDCDAHGLLDAQGLSKLDPADWDAVVVSDPFGNAESFEPIARVCRRLGKSLIVEGFAALDTVRRRRSEHHPEALSLGPEQPWGVESLGMALVHAEDEADLRRLVRGERSGRRGEIASAPCPASERALRAARLRLVDLTRDGTRRHLQYRRLASFAAATGWTVLGPASTLERFATPMAIPLLSPRAIERGRMEAGLLGLRLAGPTPDARCTVARSLHARLMLVPCDPALEAYGNDEIRRALRAALPLQPEGRIPGARPELRPAPVEAFDR